jgi:hypothetical protein
MAIDPDAYPIDPFHRAKPGQSLTAPPGEAPYEKPPMTASVEEAAEAILEGINEPIQKENLIRLMGTDLSVETIASGIVMQAFSNGMLTPDMAELIKPVLVLALVGIAHDAGIENLRIFNKPVTPPISFDSVSDIVSKLENARGTGDSGEEDTMEMADQEQMEAPMDMPDGSSEGFINREPTEEMGMMEEQI